MKQQKGLQAKDQQREVTAEIRNLLNSKVACLNSLSGNPSGSGFTPITIRDSSAAPGAAMYTVNTNDKTGLLRFDEFRVSNFVVDPTNANLGTAELQIKLSKVGDTGTVKNVKPDIIMLKVMRNVAGNITECFSIGGKNEALWQIGTNLSDIYYNGGNVGIGTNAPVSALEVNGGIISSGENTWNVHQATSFANAPNIGSAFLGTKARGSRAAPTYPLNGDTLGVVTFRDDIDKVAPPPTYGGADMQVIATENFSNTAKGSKIVFSTTSNGTNSALGKMTILGNGNVGIGSTTPTTKLEVAGEIKLGNTSSACNAANEGQMRYNSTLKIMQYCNGTTWTATSGSSFDPLSCTTVTVFAVSTNCSCPVGRLMRSYSLTAAGPGYNCTMDCCG